MAKDVYTLTDLENWDSIGGELELPAKVSVFGDPVEHSLSPQLHNPGLAACGLDAQYIRLHIAPEEFADALKRIREIGFVGTNCTIPHKFAALENVDQVDGLAEKLGAVNTVVFDGEKSIGFNSDGPGFLRAVREEFMVDVKDLRVMILGAGGGAGRAVAVQCAVEDCERLVLVNRTVEKVNALKDELTSYFDDDRVQGAKDRLVACPWDAEALKAELDDVDLIVNGSSLGMKRTDPELLPAHLIQPHHMIFDMVYSPPETPFMNAARSAGARSTNGIAMLLWQGVYSFEWWFNRTAPVEAMRAGLMEALKAKG